MLPNFQGFWLALSAYEDAPSVFVSLLALCEEFSVSLDYNTPVSGGEWVVMVAHFGDRTTFRFPRLNFNARDAYNQLSQRLTKAEKKAQGDKELSKSVPAGDSVDGLREANDESPDRSSAVDTAGSAPDKADAVSDEGKSSEAGTPDVAGSLVESSTEAESSSDTTSSAKDAPAENTSKKTRK